jgi:hypothetical protein
MKEIIECSPLDIIVIGSPKEPVLDQLLFRLAISFGTVFPNLILFPKRPSKMLSPQKHKVD